MAIPLTVDQIIVSLIIVMLDKKVDVTLLKQLPF